MSEYDKEAFEKFKLSGRILRKHVRRLRAMFVKAL